MNASQAHPLEERIERIGAAILRHLGLRMREVQRSAGICLLARRIAEMQTGEGKTLVTVIPAALLASEQRKVMIATANDYLAARDAEWMEPVYAELGLTVGHVCESSSTTERCEAYQRQVTYGTLRQFSLDHLRGSLSLRRDPQSSPPNVPLDVLLVDEADSVLIDEARTPLIIHAGGQPIDAANEACYRWAAELASHCLEQADYVRTADTGAIALTGDGRRRVLSSTMPDSMNRLTTTELLHGLERAIWVNHFVHLDQHYVVNDDRVHLVDEYTGRSASQRRFGGGIQQAIEAREGLPVTAPSEAIARVTVQDFVAKFRHVAGLTATAWEDRHELRSVYDLKVERIATHVPSRRVILPPRVSPTRQQKWQSIAVEARKMIGDGRAVLIGTRTVSQSEQLSDVLHQHQIEHVVLNARNPESEAAIVADAGQRGRVTIATNMAGRGTDIRLAPEVARAGGLHVIVSEPHAAARIDRQLIGRCGRQGDPGSARLFVSPEDEVLAQAFGPERAAKLGKLSERALLSRLRQAQRIVARNHRRQRAQLTAREMWLADSMRLIGLDPHLDPLPEHL